MSATTTTTTEHKEPPTPNRSPSAPKRHSKFYFDNTLVVIQVENTLFNVHKYQLVKSETFSDMFKLPKEDSDEPMEGSSPEHPIVMKGVSASDFEALLTVLYATHFSTNQPSPEASLIIPSFRLANMWNFSELRSYLLPLAGNVLSDVDKIVFAREFEIKDWLAPAHVKICQRSTTLTTDEATKLGAQSVLLVHRMREQHSLGRLPNMNVNQYHCANCAGITYYSSGSYTCCKCSSSHYGSFYYTGKGATSTASSTAATTANAALESQVKQWVANGCVFKD